MKKKRCMIVGFILVLIVSAISCAVPAPVTPPPPPTPVTPSPSPAPVAPSLTELERSTSEFITRTQFPLIVTGLSPVASVDSSNLSTLLEDIVDSTAIMNVDNGVFIEMIRLRDALQTGEVSGGQREAYKNGVVAGFLSVGDWVIEVKWRTDAGIIYSTLAIVASDGTPRYEPVIYFGPPSSEILQSTLSSQSLVLDFWKTLVQLALPKKLGGPIDLIVANIKVIVDTPDGCGISDQSVLITFGTMTGFEAKATKEETHIECGECPDDPGRPIEGKKVIVTITWASGFKTIKGAVGAGGFSASVEVEGRIGANGQQQHVLVVCADGTATVDGKPVPLR